MLTAQTTDPIMFPSLFDIETLSIKTRTSLLRYPKPLENHKSKKWEINAKKDVWRGIQDCPECKFIDIDLYKKNKVNKLFINTDSKIVIIQNVFHFTSCEKIYFKNSFIVIFSSPTSGWTWLAASRLNLGLKKSSIRERMIPKPFKK